MAAKNRPQHPLFVSVATFRQRAERFLERDATSRAVTGFRLVRGNPDDPALRRAIKAAACLDNESVNRVRGNLIAAARSKWSYWLTWAFDTLESAGETLPTDAQRYADIVARHPTPEGESAASPVFYAASLVYDMLLWQHAPNIDDQVQHEQRVTDLLQEIERLSERLADVRDVEAGRQARAILAKGGARAAKKREENLGRLGWRKEARRLDSMMDDDTSRKERAGIIASRLGGLSWRTVYDSLPPRRRRKSSR